MSNRLKNLKTFCKKKKEKTLFQASLTLARASYAKFQVRIQKGLLIYHLALQLTQLIDKDSQRVSPVILVNPTFQHFKQRTI